MIDMEEEIGLATIYRILNQFENAGIIIRHNFERRRSLFKLTQQQHHDHLTCLDCRKVIEFGDDAIEKRQHNIAQKYGMHLINHSLYLYGHCVLKKCCTNRSLQDKLES